MLIATSPRRASVDEAGRNSGQAFAPAFPPMASDEQPPVAVLLRSGAKQRHSLEKRIDARVAGDVDGSGRALAPKVRRIQPSGSEQQIGQSIDGDAEVFLRPGIFRSWLRSPASTCPTEMPDCAAPSAPPKALDVSPCTTTSCALAMAAPIVRATSLAWSKRIGLPAATELGRGERGHAVIGRAKMRVLAGQHQVRPDAAMEERFG